MILHNIITVLWILLLQDPVVQKAMKMMVTRTKKRSASWTTICRSVSVQPRSRFTVCFPVIFFIYTVLCVLHIILETIANLGLLGLYNIMLEWDTILYRNLYNSNVQFYVIVWYAPRWNVYTGRYNLQKWYVNCTRFQYYLH